MNLAFLMAHMLQHCRRIVDGASLKGEFRQGDYGILRVMAPVMARLGLYPAMRLSWKWKIGGGGRD
jgi:hypothetical protein